MVIHSVRLLCIFSRRLALITEISYTGRQNGVRMTYFERVMTPVTGYSLAVWLAV